MRKVAIYARVSTEHEAQISALENQVQYYDDIISKHPDWELYDRYIDEGITGTSVKKRKNFMRMIKDAEKGYFDLIITREVSRFARNTVDTLQETRKLKKQGVEVYFTEDNIWTFKDEDGELKLTLMATLAQNESKKTSMRVKAGQKISFMNGVVYGSGNILGYDRVGKEMIINEEQAETVRFIYSSFLNGQGTSKIAKSLEEKGYLTAMGLRNWSAATVVRILRNPFYCGTIVYRKQYVPDFLEQKKVKNKGQVETFTIEGKHTPIISKEDFEKVKKIMDYHASFMKPQNKEAKNIRLVPRVVPKSIWSKKMVCKCGSHFNKRAYTGLNREKFFSYICYNQKNYGSYKYRLKKGLDTTHSCDVNQIAEWKLETMAYMLFKKIWKDSSYYETRINEIIDKLSRQEEEEINKDKEIKNNNMQIEFNRQKLKRLLEVYISGDITKEEYNEKSNELNTTIKKLEEEIELYTGDNDFSTKEKLEKLKEFLLSFCKIEDNYSMEKLIEYCVDKIIVYNDKYEWRFNFFDNEIFLNYNQSYQLESELPRQCC